MTITAQLHDGRRLSFPDGTDESVVQSTVQRELGLATDNGDSALQKLAQSFAPTPEKPEATIIDAIQTGLKHSAFGTIASRGVTEQQQDFNWYQRAASNVSTLVADAPFLVLGGVAGGVAGTAVGGPGLGTVAGAGAGAFALPEAIRQTLIEGYSKGWFTDFGDFWTRFTNAVVQTGKSATLGAVIGPAGVAGKIAVPAAAPAIAKTAAQVSAEIAAMSTLGPAMEGRVPSWQDVMDNAILLGGAKFAFHAAGLGGTSADAKIAEVQMKAATGVIAEKLGKTYTKTGITPEQVVEEARSDPTIIQDLASVNRDVPESLAGKERSAEAKSEAEQAKAEPAETGGKPPEEPPKRTGGQERTPSEKAILDRIVEHPEKEKMTLSERLHSWYNETFDQYHRIAQAQVEKGIEKGELGPYEVTRLTSGVAGKAAHFLEFSTFDPRTYAETGEGYQSVLKRVSNDPKGFEAYIVAKHAIEREAAGKATGIDIDAARKVVADGAARFEQASAARVSYKDKLLDFWQKAGMIDAEGVARMRAMYQAHVPLYRLFESEARPTSGKTPRQVIKRAKGSEREILDPIESDIRDTYLMIALAEQNMARQEYVNTIGEPFVKKVKATVRPIVLQEAELRKMFDELVSVKKQTSTSRTETETRTGGGEAAESKVVEKTTQRVRDALTARGFSENEANIMIKRVGLGTKGGEVVEKIIKEIETTTYVPELDTRIPAEAATIFRAMQQQTGKNEISVFENGKRVVYEVHPDIKRAFEGMDVAGAGLLSSMLRTPARWLRSGVTLSPDFIMRNASRDAVMAFVIAGAHPIKTVKGTISYFREDQAYKNWLKGGGANAAMVSLDRRYIEQHIYKLEQETGMMGKVWNLVKTPFDALAIVSETVENVTRLGMKRDELMMAKDKAQIQALSYIAREGTVDFARHGADPFLRQWTLSTAFMNPALQGMDRVVRAFKDNPVGTTARAVASVTLPSLLLWWRNHDDPRWKDIPDWQRDLFWIVFADKWEPPQDENDLSSKYALGLAKEINGKLMVNNGLTYRIPKPFEIGVLFGSVPERIMDAYVADKPDAFKNLGKTIANIFGVNVIPTVAIPPLQQMMNFNTFTDRPLIPDSLKNMLPEYQYTAYTTEATKALGSIIGSFPGMHDKSFASPIVIDNYIRGWSGTLGTYALQIADAALRKTGVLPDPGMPTRAMADIPAIRAFVVRYPDAQAQSVQDFYDNFDKAQTVHNTVRRLAMFGQYDAAQREMALGQESMLKLQSIRTAIGRASRFIQLIHANPQLGADEKRQLIDTVYAQMIVQAKTGNTMMQAYKDAVRKPEETLQ